MISDAVNNFSVVGTMQSTKSDLVGGRGGDNNFLTFFVHDRDVKFSHLKHSRTCTQTKVLFQHKRCYVLKICSCSFWQKVIFCFNSFVISWAAGLRQLHQQKLNYSVQVTPRGLGIIFFPTKCYQLFFLLNSPPPADGRVSWEVRRVLPGQPLHTGAAWLGCCKVA